MQDETFELDQPPQRRNLNVVIDTLVTDIHNQLSRSRSAYTNGNFGLAQNVLFDVTAECIALQQLVRNAGRGAKTQKGQGGNKRGKGKAWVSPHDMAQVIAKSVGKSVYNALSRKEEETIAA